MSGVALVDAMYEAVNDRLREGGSAAMLLCAPDVRDALYEAATKERRPDDHLGAMAVFGVPVVVTKWAPPGFYRFLTSEEVRMLNTPWGGTDVPRT